MPAALIWQEFAIAAPDLAAKGRALLYQFGLGLGFLATVRRDGGPRLHPVCPIVHDGMLCVFVVGASPKRFDLERDGRYALHSFPPAETDDEFYCAGPARRVADAAQRRALASLARHEVRDDEVLFELLLERALHTTWINPRQPGTRPVYTRWSA